MTRPAARTRRSARSPGRGIALVLVLWVLTLLTVMGLGLTLSQRTTTALTDTQIEGARFAAAADAAIAYAMYHFLLPPGSFADPETGDAPEDPEAAAWVPDGQPRPWLFAGSRLEIAVFDERSRINLNTAPPELLGALLVAAGVPEEDAPTLADAIVDWRDEDDLRQLNGAEDDDYRADGRAFGAKDGPFGTVDELQQVLGMVPALYQRLVPALTVDAEGALVDTRYASALVLAALQGIPVEEAELQIQERDDPALAGTRGPGVVERGGPLYRIQVRAGGAAGRGRGMEALVELAPGQVPPYQLLWRRFGLPAAAGAPMGAPAADGA